MHIWTKIGIGFVAGAVVGALVTHLYYKETIKNTVDRKVFMIVGDRKDKPKKEVEVENIVNTHLPQQPTELDLSTFSSGKVDYTRYFTKPATEEEIALATAYPEEDDDYMEDDAVGMDATQEFQEAIKRGPRLATYDELQQPTTSVLKQLFFYPDTGELTDTETGEEIEDPRALVGDLLTSSGFASSDERDSTLLVINDALGENYEIIKAY